MNSSIRSISRLDQAEQRRRRDLVARAFSGIPVEHDSELSRAVKAISDRFISGEIEQTAYLSELRTAIRGESAGSGS